MKTIVFAVTSFLFIVLILVVFLALTVFKNQDGFLQTSITQPTPFPTPITSFTTPAVRYNTEKTNQLVESAKNRQTLSQTGVVSKQALIDKLGGISGEVHKSSNVRIDYIESADLFQAELISANINLAKQEAISWMLAQGFTQQDLCYLPFSFYLGILPRKSLETSGQSFNPLPDGC